MTDHDTHEVKGCAWCPYAHQGGNGGPGDVPWWASCEHPPPPPGDEDIQDIRDYIDTHNAPNWCPLRTRPVLVRLAAKESK